VATVTTERRETGLDELERLWEASTPEPTPARLLWDRMWRAATRRWTLAGAWIVAIGVLGAAPVPADEADAPLVWWDAVYLVGTVLVVVGAGFLVARLARVPRGWASSAVAGGLGVVLGIECRASGHHLGTWWLVEAAAFAAVLAVSVAGAASRRSAAS
jgi:hypothetical protein